LLPEKCKTRTSTLIDIVVEEGAVEGRHDYYKCNFGVK